MDDWLRIRSIGTLEAFIASSVGWDATTLPNSTSCASTSVEFLLCCEPEIEALLSLQSSEVKVAYNHTGSMATLNPPPVRGSHVSASFI